MLHPTILQEIRRKIGFHFIAILITIILVWLLPNTTSLKLGAAFLLLLLGWMIYRFRRNKGTFTKAIRETFLFDKNGKKGLVRFIKQIIQAEKAFTRMISEPFIRPHEKKNPYAISFYLLLACMILLILFDKIILILGLIPLVSGDIASTFIGLLYGKRKLIGNRTLEGSLAFFITTFIAIFAFSTFVPALAIFNPAILALIVSVVSTLTELIPVEDNISIPVVTCFILGLATLI